MAAADLVAAVKKDRTLGQCSGAMQNYVAPKSVIDELYLKWHVYSYRNLDDCEDMHFRNFMRAVLIFFSCVFCFT